jgi:hypothetical protein
VLASLVVSVDPIVAPPSGPGLVVDDIPPLEVTLDDGDVVADTPNSPVVCEAVVELAPCAPVPPEELAPIGPLSAGGLAGAEHDQTPPISRTPEKNTRLGSEARDKSDRTSRGGMDGSPSPPAERGTAWFERAWRQPRS